MQFPAALRPARARDQHDHGARTLEHRPGQPRTGRARRHRLPHDRGPDAQAGRRDRAGAADVQAGLPRRTRGRDGARPTGGAAVPHHGLRPRTHPRRPGIDTGSDGGGRELFEPVVVDLARRREGGPRRVRREAHRHPHALGEDRQRLGDPDVRGPRLRSGRQRRLLLRRRPTHRPRPGRGQGEGGPRIARDVGQPPRRDRSART